MSDTTPTPAIETDDVDAHIARVKSAVDPEPTDDTEAHAVKIGRVVDEDEDEGDVEAHFNARL